MSTRWISISASFLALATLSESSFSQAPPPPDAPAPAARSRLAIYDPQQFPSQRGEVQQFTLTARGDIDGLILKDGTQIITPPALSTQIAFSIKPGDRVTIHGLHAAALPLVRAVSITDNDTHRTVTDADIAPGGPPPPRAAPLGRREDLSEVAGRVRMTLHGPQGDVNGVLLDSGAILRFPPDQADQFASLLQPSQSLVAEGVSNVNPLGTVFEVRELGASRDRLRPIEAPAGPDDRRNPGAARDAGPPPVGAPPPPPAPPPP